MRIWPRMSMKIFIFSASLVLAMSCNFLTVGAADERELIPAIHESVGASSGGSCSVAMTDGTAKGFSSSSGCAVGCTQPSTDPLDGGEVYEWEHGDTNGVTVFLPNGDGSVSSQTHYRREEHSGEAVTTTSGLTVKELYPDGTVKTVYDRGNTEVSPKAVEPEATTEAAPSRKRVSKKDTRDLASEAVELCDTMEEVDPTDDSLASNDADEEIVWEDYDSEDEEGEIDYFPE